MEGYSVKIAVSSRELSAKERIALKDTSNATRLDVACEGADVVFKPMAYAVLDIHNEKSDNVDYKNYIIIDEDGNTYVTGSEAFWTTFIDIFEEMEGEDEEWALKCYKLDSKNYKGKQFLTCSII